MNTSLSEYSDRATMSRSCFVSAWKAYLPVQELTSSRKITRDDFERARTTQSPRSMRMWSDAERRRVGLMQKREFAAERRRKEQLRSQRWEQGSA
jgi:hypothetical protein